MRNKSLSAIVSLHLYVLVPLLMAIQARASVYVDTVEVGSTQYVLYKGIVQQTTCTYDNTWPDIEDRFVIFQRTTYPEGYSWEITSNAQYSIITTAYWNGWSADTQDGYHLEGFASSYVRLVNTGTVPVQVYFGAWWVDLAQDSAWREIASPVAEYKYVTIPTSGVSIQPPRYHVGNKGYSL